MVRLIIGPLTRILSLGKDNWRRTMKTKKLQQDVHIGAIIVIFCAVFFYVNKDLTNGAGTMPRILLGVMLLFGILILLSGIKKTMAATDENPPKKLITFSDIKVPMITYVYIISFLILFYLVGYFVAAPVFLVTLMRHFKMKSWKVITLVVVIFILFIFFLFVKQLNVNADNFGIIGNYIKMNLS